MFSLHPNNIYQEIGISDTLTSSEVEKLCAHQLEHQKAESSPKPNKPTK